MNGKHTLASGFVVDTAAAAAHVMQPLHVRGIQSSRGLEEGKTKFHRPPPLPVPLGFDTDGFVAALHSALAASTAGYVMQLRQHGRPIASSHVSWAKLPADGGEAWAETVRMHVASCSKLITAIAMTRALAAHGIAPTAKISAYLPAYWAKGPNIDQITFAQLLTHRSGFRVAGSDMSFPTMKALIEGGVQAADLGTYSYQNTNFGICRILLPVVDGTIAAGTTFPFTEDQLWDWITINAYSAYVARHLFAPAGVVGPTLTHPNPDALAYAFPTGPGWNSGDLTTESGGAGWHMSVDDLLDVMGAFRRGGSIASRADAQAMLDAGYGIDLIETTALGKLYNKNGLWRSGAAQTEQSLAYFLPRDMELVVFANSPIGATGQFFRDVVTDIYLDHIVPELPVGAWIGRHGLTAEAYQEAFDDYIGNHGMELSCTSGYGAHYAALWRKTAGHPAWQARHGLTSAQYQQAFDHLVAEGYTPVLVNGYETPQGVRFACKFSRDIAGAWVARHDLTAAQYQAVFDEHVRAGFTLAWVSGYFDGIRDRYAAIWRKQPDAPTWQARHGLTAAEYQHVFDELSRSGFKLAVVSGYSDGAQVRYAAIFRKIDHAMAWQARHGLTAAEYQAAFDQLRATGYRLELVNGCTAGGRDHFAAIWTL